VDYAISAFWLMRRDLIELTGPLDERIFYAPEDVDFCLRVWLKGRRVVYRPDLEVVHDAKEQSRSLRGLLFTWRDLQGLLYYFRKHGYAFSTDRLYRRIGRPRTGFRPAPMVSTHRLQEGPGG
jgi:GT2 family glycosyltransferase